MPDIKYELKKYFKNGIKYLHKLFNMCYNYFSTKEFNGKFEGSIIVL